MEFSEKLRALRDQRGLKQPDLAAAAGLTTNKIQRYEQSGQKPKGGDALALARALGVSADYLLDDGLSFPPPEECLSEKVVIIRKLEGLIGALLSRGTEGAGGARGGAGVEFGAGGTFEAVGRGELPDVVRLPVFKLGAGFDVTFDELGQPAGEKARDMYFDGLGEGRFFAAELYGSSMQGPGGAGFALGEVLVLKAVRPDEAASGDYVYVRTGELGLFRQLFVHGDRLRLRAINPADPEVVVERHDVAAIWRLVRRVKDY